MDIGDCLCLSAFFSNLGRSRAVSFSANGTRSAKARSTSRTRRRACSRASSARSNARSAIAADSFPSGGTSRISSAQAKRAAAGCACSLSKRRLCGGDSNLRNGNRAQSVTHRILCGFVLVARSKSAIRGSGAACDGRTESEPLRSAPH